MVVFLACGEGISVGVGWRLVAHMLWSTNWTQIGGLQLPRMKDGVTSDYTHLRQVGRPQNRSGSLKILASAVQEICDEHRGARAMCIPKATFPDQLSKLPIEATSTDNTYSDQD